MSAARRLRVTLLLLAIVFLSGTLGYHHLARGEYSVLDCAYMTIITMSTVGYTEVIDPHGKVYGPTVRLYTMVLILIGMSVMLYGVSSVTAFIVDGELKNVLWWRRMTKMIRRFDGHYIVCGVGNTGLHAIRELALTHRQVVVIESDDERIAQLPPTVAVVRGRAENDDVLKSAGIERAAGLIAVLPSDQDNLFVTVSARLLNPQLRIVSRGSDRRSRAKLLRAGADSAVSPPVRGGYRMVAEMIRPAVVSFLDIMLRDPRMTMRVEDVSIGEGSELVGKRLGSSGIRERYRTSVIALRLPGEAEFHVCPDAATELNVGVILVVVGDVDQVSRLRTLAKHAPRIHKTKVLLEESAELDRTDVTGKTGGHFIVCGVDQTGQNVVSELLEMGYAVQIIERDEERARRTTEQFGCSVITGDAHDDKVLEEAGIREARGLISALPDDHNNLFVAIAAKQLNPRLRLVCRAVELSSMTKLKESGADAVVSPSLIGGMRIASEMVRPATVEFLDRMLRDRDRGTHIQECITRQDSAAVGKTIGEAEQATGGGAIILAVKHVSDTFYTYNPEPSSTIEPQSVVVVLGDRASLERMRQWVEERAET